MQIIRTIAFTVGGCLYGHVAYDDDAEFPCSDGCNKCRCRHSKIMCTTITCEHGGLYLFTSFNRRDGLTVRRYGITIKQARLVYRNNAKWSRSVKIF